MVLRNGPSPRIEIPPGMLDAVVAGSLLRPQFADALQNHYCGSLPAMLAKQLRGAGGAEEKLFGAKLLLAKLPRLQRALHALFALAADAGLQCSGVFGAETPEGLAEGRTLGELYVECHFGRSMPMLYAYPGDLPVDDGERNPLSFIDARLVGPLIHELSHFRTAAPPAPANLHEALAAFIGSEAWPAQVWPADGEEDAIPGCAFFAAAGGWLVRAIGCEDALRVQAGLADLRDLLGSDCAEALRLYGFLPFLTTGAPHLLSDAFHPERWWKLIDLHRDKGLAAELSRRFAGPMLAGTASPQREWDSWLDALAWRDLPASRDEPQGIDVQLAQRAEHALQVRAQRRGMTFQARKVPAVLQLDKELCLLRSSLEGPDAVGAPPVHPYPPALCRE